MKRVEIVLNQSIEEDFFSRLEKEQIKRFYTKFVDAEGEGCQIPKKGTPIWPQLNNVIVMVLEDEYIPAVRQIVEDLRSEFPDEGVFASVSDVETL